MSIIKPKYRIEYKIYPRAVKAMITLDWSTWEQAIVYLNLLRPINDSLVLQESTFIGKAVYKDGDVFDIDMAKKIARKKALRAMYSYFFNYEKKLMAIFDTITENLEKEMATFSTKKLQITQEIKAMT